MDYKHKDIVPDADCWNYFGDDEPPYARNEDANNVVVMVGDDYLVGIGTAEVGADGPEVAFKRAKKEATRSLRNILKHVE